jgi:hypothetical protein
VSKTKKLRHRALTISLATLPRAQAGFLTTLFHRVFQGRQPRMVRRLRSAFDRSKPLGLFGVLHPATERLNSKTKKEKVNETASC